LIATCSSLILASLPNLVDQVLTSFFKDFESKPRKWGYKLSKCMVFLMIIFSGMLSVSHIGSDMINYGGFMREWVNIHLHFNQNHHQEQQSTKEDIQTICVGDDWYRFPSHFFLPVLNFFQFDFHLILFCLFVFFGFFLGGK